MMVSIVVKIKDLDSSSIIVSSRGFMYILDIFNIIRSQLHSIISWITVRNLKFSNLY